MASVETYSIHPRNDTPVEQYDQLWEVFKKIVEGKGATAILVPGDGHVLPTFKCVVATSEEYQPIADKLVFVGVTDLFKMKEQRTFPFVPVQSDEYMDSLRASAPRLDRHDPGPE